MVWDRNYFLEIGCKEVARSVFHMLTCKESCAFTYKTRIGTDTRFPDDAMVTIPHAYVVNAKVFADGEAVHLRANPHLMTRRKRQITCDLDEAECSFMIGVAALHYESWKGYQSAPYFVDGDRHSSFTSSWHAAECTIRNWGTTFRNAATELQRKNHNHHNQTAKCFHKEGAEGVSDALGGSWVGNEMAIHRRPI